MYNKHNIIQLRILSLNCRQRVKKSDLSDGATRFFMDAKVQQTIDILAEEFPEPKSELNFNSPFELLVAVILSAQCTDKRVNIVTPKLFAVADDAFSMSQLDLSVIEDIIHPCGFYHNKALFISNMSKDLVERFNGEVPSDIDSLRTLAGVGRKTANVVYAVGFGGQAIAVDTHVFRVANRLGLVHANSVYDTEKQLMNVLPHDKWSDCHHYLLLHGRYVCKARNPQCGKCPLTHLCEYYAKGEEN